MGESCRGCPTISDARDRATATVDPPSPGSLGSARIRRDDATEARTGHRRPDPIRGAPDDDGPTPEDPLNAPASTAARLVVVAGPSGVGKGTVVAQALGLDPGIWLSVSATTRAPRPGEVDGVNYRFLDREAFMAQVAAGGMLEWAEFAGNLYGTPRAPVEERLAQGVPVLLEIELEGARQVRRTAPEALQVFLAPPDVAELERRLRGRGTEDDTSVARRLAIAATELAAQGEFDVVVVNDDAQAAARRLVALVRS
jgi:guanylate kinase